MDSSPSLSKSQKRSGSADDEQTAITCCFCASAPAAVLVHLPSSSRKRGPTEPKPYCLLHYYTTRAVRSKQVSLLCQEEVEKQLLNDNNGGMQQLFAEAFTELQQELSETSARAFAAHASDPLAVLHDLRGKPKKRPPSIAKKKKQAPEGGFLRTVPLPERLLQTQQRQHDLQTQQLQQIKSVVNSSGNPYKRRKSSRKSIWNLAMEQPSGSVMIPTFDPTASAITGVSCSCGSSNVTSAGNITGRNSELTKGETWGNKDRSDALVNRYQCESCGKVWNEEE